MSRRRLVVMLCVIGLGSLAILAMDAILPRGSGIVRPTPTPDVGQIRRIGAGATPLWVNEGAYLIAATAIDERDDRTLDWARRTYERLDVPAGTAVRVLKIDGGRCQVEILGVPYVGRRGWAPCASLAP